jgi:sugar phosphate isomerase/epimerase
VDISVSNIGFRGLALPQFGPLLHSNEIAGIEITISESFGSLEAAESESKAFLRDLKSYGLRVSGIQSLLHNMNHLQLFRIQDWAELRPYFLRLIRLAASVETSILVFGSPRNRLKGSLTKPEANLLFEEFIVQLIPELMSHEVRIAIEPNAREYGADYLTDYVDVIEFCNQVNSPFVVPQIDTGCLELEGVNLLECLSLKVPSHVHLSAPGLGDIERSKAVLAFLEGLVGSSYQEWVTIEMLGNGMDGLDRIIRAARIAQNATT